MHLSWTHTHLAIAGSASGIATLDASIAYPRCRSWVEELWYDAAASVPLPAESVESYRAALLERFSNARMSDDLRRIAMDGSQKIPVRIVPAIITERAAGKLPRGAARALAAWIAHLRGIGAPFNDARGESWRETAAGETAAAAANVLDRLGIGDDPALLDAVVEEYANFDA